MNFIYCLDDIRKYFGIPTLIGLLSLLVSLLFLLFYYRYWNYQKREPFRKAFTDFKQVFLPAFEMCKEGQITYEQIVFSEFPKHKDAMTTFLHIHALVWYRRIYFNRKWKEYESTYNNLKDFLSKSTFPEGWLVSRRGEKEDAKRKEQLLGHLKCLMRIAKQY